MKAGQLFSCACCALPTPEDEASFDAELKGPVCKECNDYLMTAKVYLAKQHIHPASKNLKNRIIDKG